MRLTEIALALSIAVAGCAAPESPTISTTVTVDLFTSRCDPDEGLREVFLETDTPTFRWDILCMRDDAATAWLALKVSDWDDRADDWWNVWYVNPDLREVAYGETPLPGVADENNPFAPDALPRVAPQELTDGSYRLEIWAVSGDLVDSTIGETKFTILPSGSFE